MKYILTIMLCICFGFYTKAQSNAHFGIKGGLNLTFFNVTESNFGTDVQTETGFYAGIFADIEIDDSFSAQLELLYIGLGDFKFINAPIYAKYEVANNLDILAGPSLNYFFDFFINKFKVRADIAAAYHIFEQLDIHVKYTLGFKEISPNGLFFGLGYRF